MSASAVPPLSSAGFTLIEVLIALIILSVGMVGISSIYIEGLRIHRSAIQRARASSLAADIAERLRAGDEELPDHAGADITATRDELTTSVHPVAIDRRVIALRWHDGRQGFATSTLTLHLPVR